MKCEQELYDYLLFAVSYLFEEGTWRTFLTLFCVMDSKNVACVACEVLNRKKSIKTTVFLKDTWITFLTFVMIMIAVNII